MNMERIKKAIVVSSTAHKNQVRKGTDIPYIVHPYEVGFILRDNDFDEDIIIAGILHDTLEDTELTREIIESEFGKKVLDIIIQVSESKLEKASLSWKERKEIAIRRLESASREAKIVACADKLSNTRSMLEGYRKNGKEFFKIFNTDDYEDHKWHYNASLKALFDIRELEIYKDLKRNIEELFCE